MPENMDESLLSAIERYKNSQDTPNDRKIIGKALASKQITIAPIEDSKIIMQAGGANFGESNEIRVSGSVIGTQSISGFTAEQVIELLRLYDSYKESGNDSATEEPKKVKRGNIRRRILFTLNGLLAIFAAFLAGLYWADLIPRIDTQSPVLKTALAFIPSTGRTPTARSGMPTWTAPLIPTSTHTSTLTATNPPTATLTPTQTYTPFPTNTQTFTPTPTNTPTLTPEVLFTDTFDDYEYSTHIGWALFTEEEGKIYRRRITRNKIDNKFEHYIDCLSQQCVGRNEIPPVAEFQNFILRFDIEYVKIPPSYTGLSRPIICVNFRRYGPRTFYSLCMKSDGQYRMVRYVNGELAIIRDWERTPVIHQSGQEKNRISLIADRGNYLFGANGIDISEFEDNHLLQPGGIEIAIFTFQNNPEIISKVKFEIDNIEIINIP